MYNFLYEERFITFDKMTRGISVSLCHETWLRLVSQEALDNLQNLSLGHWMFCIFANISSTS